MKRIAVFAGSFDPFTLGHQDIVERSLTLFDQVIIAIGENSTKKKKFSLEKRKQIILDVFSSESRVSVTSYKGLTVNFCEANKADFLVRGIRNSRDLDFEQSIAQANKRIAPQIETVFLVTAAEYSAINSSIVRDIYSHGGDVSSFLPKGITLE